MKLPALASLVLTIGLPFLGLGCEGAAIDGGGSKPVSAGSSSSAPVVVPNSFFGRLSARRLTRTSSPEGTEVDAAAVGITFEITFGEDGLYALDDGKTCLRGEYQLKKGLAGRGVFTFTPAVGAAPDHPFEFREKDLVVADLVPGYPWAHLERTLAKSRCDLP